MLYSARLGTIDIGGEREFPPSLGWIAMNTSLKHPSYPRNAMIFLKTVAVIATGLSVAAMAQPHPPAREWTVLVYMNGKNSLEPDVLNNFHSMAEIGSSEQVTFLAEVGRPVKRHYTNEDGGWSGVYRFYIKKGILPIPKDAEVNVGALGESTDMGKPAALSSFIRWGKLKYPARRYMLVIWNHGQGWRLELARDSAAHRPPVLERVSASAAPRSPSTSAPLGGFRAVSVDDDTGSILFNREIQDIAMNEFGPRGLSVLGFDACLMAMAETAYAFAPTTEVLVSSEELEPASGWHYSQWMNQLIANPTISNRDLGRAIVEMYRSQYGNEYITTLSALDLTDIRKTFAELSTFADAVIRAGAGELANIKTARSELSSYGASTSPPLRTSVDLMTLLIRFESLTKNDQLREQSAQLRDHLSKHVIDNYASTRSADTVTGNPYGSKGIAIYFPESYRAFLADGYHKGYLKENTDRPVDFVKNESWPEMLYQILALK